MDAMNKLSKILERILNADDKQRKDLIEAYKYFDFQGDDLKIFQAIESLPSDFTFHDLAIKFKAKERKNLISLCTEACLSRICKEIIDEMRKNDRLEYIELFKQPKYR